MLTRNQFTKIALLAALLIAQPVAVSADATMAEGIKLFGQKNYTQAFYAFETAKANPSNAAQAMYYQAMCYLSMGQTDYARQTFTCIIDSYPGSSSSMAAKSALERIAASNSQPGSPAGGLSGAAGALEGAPSAGSGWQAGTQSGVPRSTFAAGFVQDKLGSPHSTGSGYKRDRFGRMIVTVKVNNKISYPMLLDTGADVCSLSLEQAQQAGIDMSETIGKATLRGTSGEAQARIYRAQLQVGTMIKTVNVYVTEKGHCDAALLGRNFFADVALEVDDTAHTIRFLDPKELRVGTESAAVPYRTNGHGMFVTAKINGRECEMVFDTGCSTTSFSDKQWSGMGLSFAAGEARSGYTAGLGGQRDAHFVNIGTVELGGVIKCRVPASVSIYGASDKPLLGMSFLQGLKYVVNPFDQKIYLSK
jgi:clan AA aspartic protease (TIGR02281 family)